MIHYLTIQCVTFDFALGFRTTRINNCLEYENQINVIKLGDSYDIEVPFHQPVLNLNRL